MASSLSTALSSMEVMLDALMQRGIGIPEDQLKPKEEPPPALPTRPTVRGRLPSLQRPGADAPWVQRLPPPSSSPLPPMQEEEEEEKVSVNHSLELERRAVKAEEEARQRAEETRQKDDEIATLRIQAQRYEIRLTECEGRMKSVQEELRKQIAALQVALAAGARRAGSSMVAASQHRQESLAAVAMQPSPSSAARRSVEASSTRRQQQQRGGGEPAAAITVADERQQPTTEVGRLAKEFQKERETFEHGARVVAAEAAASAGGAKSADDLKTLKRQFAAWRKEYEARLRKAKAEIKKAGHADKAGHGEKIHGQKRRCGWWRLKAPKCRAPKCCAFKLPSLKSCCPCFRRCC